MMHHGKVVFCNAMNKRIISNNKRNQQQQVIFAAAEQPDYELSLVSIRSNKLETNQIPMLLIVGTRRRRLWLLLRGWWWASLRFQLRYKQCRGSRWPRGRRNGRNRVDWEYRLNGHFDPRSNYYRKLNSNLRGRRHKSFFDVSLWDLLKQQWQRE